MSFVERVTELFNNLLVTCFVIAIFLAFILFVASLFGFDPGNNKEKAERYESEIEKYKEQISKYETEISELKNENLNLDRENSSLQTDIDNLTVNYDYYVSENKALVQQLLFYQTFVALAEVDGDLYHTYGCEKLSQDFYIYGVNAAENKGYKPCEICCVDLTDFFE